MATEFIQILPDAINWKDYLVSLWQMILVF